MRKERKYHYIYKTTCSVTGKYYIGMHSTDDLDDGYIGSGKRLWFSINYHGKENHTKEILEFCENRAELKEREREIVNEQLLEEDLCMNLIVGGEGGRRFTSDEAKKGGEAYMEKYGGTDTFYQCRSKGGKTTYERHGLSENFKPDWVGRKHSDETKQKMSEAKKGKGTGKANSQFGTCWITNGTETKKVKKEELESYLHSGEGWRTGRK